jgi:hypothetical protein
MNVLEQMLGGSEVIPAEGKHLGTIVGPRASAQHGLGDEDGNLLNWLCGET